MHLYVGNLYLNSHLKANSINNFLNKLIFFFIHTYFLFYHLNHILIKYLRELYLKILQLHACHLATLIKKIFFL